MYFNPLKTDIHLYCTTQFILYPREHNMSTLRRPITDTISLFFALCPSSTFFKKHDVSEAGTASVFRQTSTQPDVHIELFTVIWDNRNTQLVKICAWEQIKSKGSKRKIAIEKLKTTTRIHKLKPQKRAMNSDSSDHRHNIKNQNTCI
jgi:hypothetical protein